MVRVPVLPVAVPRVLAAGLLSVVFFSDVLSSVRLAPSLVFAVDVVVPVREDDVLPERVPVAVVPPSVRLPLAEVLPVREPELPVRAPLAVVPLPLRVSELEVRVLLEVVPLLLRVSEVEVRVPLEVVPLLLRVSEAEVLVPLDAGVSALVRVLVTVPVALPRVGVVPVEVPRVGVVPVVVPLERLLSVEPVRVPVDVPPLLRVPLEPVRTPLDVPVFTVPEPLVRTPLEAPVLLVPLPVRPLPVVTTGRSTPGVHTAVGCGAGVPGVRI